MQMNITIVGGGTIGWLTAFILSKRTKYHNITVIDSSKNPIIGVGEALTGLVSDLFLDNSFGLNEQEFIEKTWALPKFGINFENWRGKNESIFTPIEGSLTSDTQEFDELFYYCLKEGIDIDYASYTGNINKHGIIPFYLKDNELCFPDNRNYSWHIDAYKFSEFFKEKTSNVNIIDKEVKSVKVDGEEITELTFDDGEKHTADFFIDATGFKRVLMSHLSNNEIDYSLRLPVNKALLFNVEQEREKKPYTNAIARNYGWTFEIPTRHKIGRGYIYNDTFVNEEEIVKELEEYYGKIKVLRTINFKSNQLEKSWVGNCLCLGLSASFLEPLQSSSLHIAQNSLEKFIITCLGQSKSETINEDVRNRFNNYVFNFNEDVVDFVQATYLCGRQDTPFWIYMNYHAPQSDRLINLRNITKHRLTRSSDYEQYYGSVGQSNWNYIWYVNNIFNKTKVNRIYNTLFLDEYSTHNIYLDNKTNFYQKGVNNNYLTVEKLNNYLKEKEVKQNGKL